MIPCIDLAFFFRASQLFLQHIPNNPFFPSFFKCYLYHLLKSHILSNLFLSFLFCSIYLTIFVPAPNHYIVFLHLIVQTDCHYSSSSKCSWLFLPIYFSRSEVSKLSEKSQIVNAGGSAGHCHCYSAVLL